MNNKPLSRQRRWQLKQMGQGMCALCKNPLAKGSRVHCEFHRDLQMERHRRDRRLLKGIALDAPVQRTKPRGCEDDWKTPEFFALLGTVRDAQLAKKFGVSGRTVQYHRIKLNIPLFKFRKTPCRSSSKSKQDPVQS